MEKFSKFSKIELKTVGKFGIYFSAGAITTRSLMSLSVILPASFNSRMPPITSFKASQASIAGKGISSQSGHTITYDCGAEHQIIMCVYHAVPMLDSVS